MKKIVLIALRRLEIIEHQMPSIVNPDEVLIKISSVGVCGSDIHYFKDGRIGSQVVEFPFVIGHECSGIIEKTGTEVKNVKVGDLVAIDPSVHCNNCDQCKAGRPHTCRNNKFLGCPGQIEGCLAEYIVMPAFTCFKLDEDFDSIKATLIEPLSVGVYSVKLANEVNEKKIGIFGCGPIGLSVLSVLKTGINKVFCFDPLRYRIDKASELGANFISNPEINRSANFVLLHAPDLLDIVFECSGDQKAVNDALEILKPGGKLILVGIPENAKYTFNMDLMRRKEISVINVRRQNNCVEEAINLIKNGLSIEKMATHKFNAEDSQYAFDLVSSYNDGVIKAIINF